MGGCGSTSDSHRYTIPFKKTVYYRVINSLTVMGWIFDAWTINQSSVFKVKQLRRRQHPS